MKRLEYRRKCGREASGHVTPSKRRSPDASSDHVTHLTKKFFIWEKWWGGCLMCREQSRDTESGGVAIFIFLSESPQMIRRQILVSDSEEGKVLIRGEQGAQQLLTGHEEKVTIDSREAFVLQVNDSDVSVLQHFVFFCLIRYFYRENQARKSVFKHTVTIFYKC